MGKNKKDFSDVELINVKVWFFFFLGNKSSLCWKEREREIITFKTNKSFFLKKFKYITLSLIG